MEAADKTLETEAVSPEYSDNEYEPDSERRQRKYSQSPNTNDSDANANRKALVADYVSDVSSEDFSGPEDGECESDGGSGAAPTTVRHHRPVRNSISGPPKQTSRRRVVLPPESARAVVLPSLVENASPIEDDDLENLSMFFLICFAFF